jgi:hypothetical protein
MNTEISNNFFVAKVENMALQSPGAKLAISHMHDWLIILILAAIDGILNMIEPFHRYIGKDMMQDLMFPFKEDTIPMWGVPVSACSHANNHP